MGIGSKEKVNDSVKDDKEFLDKEKDKKNFNEISKRDEINDSKDDKLKSYDKDNKLIQETQEEKKESKWGKIDWNKDTSKEKKKSKWDKISWNNEYSENEKIEGYTSKNLKDNAMIGENYDKKIEGLKDFDEDFEAKEIEEVFLEEKKDELDNKYVGENCVEEFKKETDEEGVDVDLLKGKKQKLEERESDLDNLNDIRENMEKVDIKNGINEKNYENLLNDDLHKNFKEYFNETGRYANWGTKIRKDFISKIDNKINNKGITETEKELLKQIKQMCNDINNKQEIKNLIMDKIQNHDLPYKEILKETEKIGLNVSLASISRISERELGKDYHKIRQGKWAFLDFDKEGILLSYNEQIQKAAEYLRNNILTDTFKKKHGLEEGIAPSIGLKDKSMIEFRGASSYRDLSFNDILEKAGLKTNVEIGKWSFLDKDNKGTPLNYNKAIEKAAEYLTQEILTDEFNTKYGIGKGEAPPMDIKNDKFRKFVSAIGGRGLSYNEILEKVRLKTNLDIGKWSFLDKDNKGNPLNYDKAIERAAEHLTQEIFTEEFNIKYGVGKREAPTIAIDDKELKKFRGAIGSRGLSYNDILEKAGLKTNLDRGKWSFLDKDNKGNPLNYDKAIEKAAEYLTQKILTDEFKEKYDLGKSEAPTMNTDDKELTQFFSAVAKRNLSYNDILENAGYKPHESVMFNRVGNNIHVIQERLFLQHTREKGCITFYEPYTNINTKKGNADGLYKKYGLRHGDNCGIIEDNFKSLSNEMKRLCEKRKDIKMIIVDYYLGNSEKTAKIHCLRGYQGKEKMLILMPTHANNQQSPPTGIPYRKNVKILDPSSFSNFMGYNGGVRKKFMESMKLAKEATWKNNGSKETLERLANECKNIIKEIYDYGHKELEEYVKNQKSNISKDILKYDPDKSNIDYYF